MTKKEREQKKFDKQIADYNERVRAEHAKLVEKIIARRPSWDVAALQAIGKSHGGSDVETLGLWDILRAVETADALDVKFAKLGECKVEVK